MPLCLICKAPLHGRQSRFCGRKCKNRHTNYHHNSYLKQQSRGRERKLRLIELFSGRCDDCGYRKNFAALEFHHTNPATKSFQLDMRSLASMEWDVILTEAKKCRLLCSNCHAEQHHPEFLVPGDAAPR